MGVTPDARELLGAYALDAVDDDEAAAVAELVAEDAAADRELHRLRGAAAWIGATEALAPPRDLRAQLLERATPVPEEVRIYRMAMARHEELLDSLPADALDRPTVNGLERRRPRRAPRVDGVGGGRDRRVRADRHRRDRGRRPAPRATSTRSAHDPLGRGPPGLARRGRRARRLGGGRRRAGRPAVERLHGVAPDAARDPCVRDLDARRRHPRRARPGPAACRIRWSSA